MSKGKILSKYKIYDYKMYEDHWNLSGKYLLNTEQILIISSCWNCGITPNPKNRIIYKNEMSYQCLSCGFELSKKCTQNTSILCECITIGKRFKKYDKNILTINVRGDDKDPFFINYPDGDDNDHMCTFKKPWVIDPINKENNSYAFICFKCCENISLCAEHVMFKLGEKVRCPNCSSEMSFIKINKNGIFKRPKPFISLDKFKI